MADIASLGVVVRPDGIQQTTQQLDGLTKAGATAEKQTAKIAPAMDKAAVSAKQLAFATRGLPAQFTDIATSLASGQNPLTVLLQQGGQIKDTFGGAVPALRAVGGYVAGLINPLTLTAGAVVALGAAWLQAAGEGDAFNRALILTGNNARTTADDLSAMAAILDDTTSATQGKAADVLAQVASTGRFTAEQINLVAEAAIRMEDATGKAIDETVKEFVALQGDPVNAILKLNEAQHFLTQETLDQIESLKEQGREADAAGVAVRAYADTINDRAPKVVENLRLTSVAWRGIKNGAKEAWDEVVDGFRRADEAAARGLSSIQRYFASTPFGGPAGAAAAAFGQSVSSAAGASTPTPTVDSAKAKAALEFEKEGLRFATQRERMEKDIADARALGVKAGLEAEQIEKRIAAIRAEYAKRERSPRTPAATRTASDPSEGIISRIKEQIAVNEAEQKSVDRLTVSERLRISVMNDLEKQGGKITAARRDQITALLAELDASGKAAAAFEDEVKAKQSLLEVTNELATAEKNRNEANRIDLLAIGRGSDQVEQLRRRLDIEREYEENVKRLNDRAASERRDVSEEEVRALQDSRDRMLQSEEAFQRQRLEGLGDWANGARAAFEDIQFEAENVAAATYDIFRGAFDGLSNVITDFITKGKGDWRGFFDSLAADITSFIVKQQLSKWLEGLMGGGTNGSGGGGLADIAAAIFGGGWGGVAKGGAFGGGVQLFANGGVVNQPQLFTHGGRMGLMGEAGPEAIVPLHRGPDGKLGIRMSTPAANAGPSMTSVSQTFVIQGRLDSRTEDQLAWRNGQEVQRATRRNS